MIGRNPMGGSGASLSAQVVGAFLGSSRDWCMREVPFDLGRSNIYVSTSERLSLVEKEFIRDVFKQHAYPGFLVKVWFGWAKPKPVDARRLVSLSLKV